METGAIGYNQVAAGEKKSGTEASRGMDLGVDTFLKLLVAQMRYQNPFGEGQDMGDFMGQVAQFTLLERVMSLQRVIENMALQQAPSQALGLLNRTVEVKTESGHILRGEVTAVRFQDGSPMLRVKDNEYPLSAVLLAEGTAEKEPKGETVPANNETVLPPDAVQATPGEGELEEGAVLGDEGELEGGQEAEHDGELNELDDEPAVEEKDHLETEQTIEEEEHLEAGPAVEAVDEEKG